MKKQTQAEVVRGRKPNPRGAIASNGLFVSQWKQIKADALAQGIDANVLLRRQIDWYYDALEKQDGKYSQKEEFEKLEQANKSHPKKQTKPKRSK